MSKQFLSTGEVAVLCAVTPDAVLKWIKSGKVPATRTPGGHFRIHQSEIPVDLIKKQTPPQAQQQKRSFKYCWEFHAVSGKTPDECQSCIVYRSRAERGYNMVHLPEEAEHAKKFFKETCENCDYYKMANSQRYNVLIVTDRAELRTSLETDLPTVNFNLTFADSEYQCSMIVNDFQPDFVVIDCTICEKQCQKFAGCLAKDPRLPFIRVIMAGEEYEFPNECNIETFAFIKQNFTLKELSELIENWPL